MTDKILKFSASALVKRSAAQLAFYMIKAENFRVSGRMIRGNEHAQEMVQRVGGSPEKRGLYADGLNTIFFCVDTFVPPNVFVEIKMVENMADYEEWYLHSSLNQAAFYAELLSHNKTLCTPTFRKKEGYQEEVLDVPEYWSYELWFGDDKYRVARSKPLFDHYLEKANVIREAFFQRDLGVAKKFDMKYKHKEYETFKPTYKRKKDENDRQ